MRQSTNGMVSGGVPPALLEEVLGRMESAVGDLADLVDPDALSGWDAPSIARLTDAHSRVRRVTGRLDGVRFTLLPRVREGVAAATARKDVTTARRLATALPVTRARLVAGEVGADHARVMTEVAPTSSTREDALAWLVDARTGEPTTPEQFVQTVVVDFPDPAEDPDGTRTREQVTQVLQDAIAEGALVLLSAGGPVFTETGGRVPRALLRRLACDSAVTRIVFGPDGAVLDVGRAQRTVTGQMRRAVIARDEHCVFPGCDQPPSRCEVHHAVTHWADGGETSVANSALLCWHHHQLVDARGITMHWTGKPTAEGGAATLLETGWAFTDARGHRIRLPEAVEAMPSPSTGPTLDPPAAAA